MFGVAVAADYMVEGVEQIVSSTKTKVVQLVKNDQVESVVIQTSVWNQTVTNLTLMVFVSYSPQILLHFLDVILKVEK